MLNQFIDELRSEKTVDLSGKNLMDEGVEYVVEGLAYNQTCTRVRLGSNGMGVRASQQLAEVLKVRGNILTAPT
jgi:Ran GTPase-activating protein (RanGAP) involved in mRNA processing and transport